MLLLDFDLKLDIELLDLPGLNLDLGFVIYRKAFRNRSDVVRTGDKAIDFVNTLMVSLGGDGFAAGTGSRDRCLGNNCSGRIGNASAHRPRSGLRRRRRGSN